MVAAEAASCPRSLPRTTSGSSTSATSACSGSRGEVLHRMKPHRKLNLTFFLKFKSKTMSLIWRFDLSDSFIGRVVVAGMLVNHLAKRHPGLSPEEVPELNLPILKATKDFYCQYCSKVRERWWVFVGVFLLLQWTLANSTNPRQFDSLWRLLT